MKSRKQEKSKRKHRQKVRRTQSQPASYIFYMTYTHSCVALNKITVEMERMYRDSGMGFRFLPQSPPFGPYKVQESDVNAFNIDEVAHLVMHRGGTHDFNPVWLPMYNSIVRARRQRGFLTHYYLDDFLVYMNDWAPPKIMQKCDKTITLGYLLKPYLEEEFGLKNVVQIKTHVDIQLFDQTDIRSGIMDKDKFNIVWFSMVRNGLGFMKELLAKMDKTDIAKDVVFWAIMPWAAYVRSELYENRNIKIKCSDFMPYQALVALEKGADLLINPLHMKTDNHEFVPDVDKSLFINSKSEVKYAHAGAAKRPLLTCKSPPYETAIKHGDNGFISDDVDEWIDIIRDLKDKPELREKVAAAARKDIEENYTIEKRFPELLNIIMEDV